MPGPARADMGQEIMLYLAKVVARDGVRQYVIFRGATPVCAILILFVRALQLHWIAVANTEVHSMQGPEYVAIRNLYKKELTRILTEVEALKDGKPSNLRVEIAGHLRELGEL